MFIGRDMVQLLTTITLRKLSGRLSGPFLKDRDPRMKLCLRKMCARLLQRVYSSDVINDLRIEGTYQLMRKAPDVSI
jgi:hypothetical protein